MQMGLIGLAFIVLYLTFIRPRRRLAAPPESSGDAGRHVRDDLDEIFIRLQEFSRETVARLDTKIRLLNQLVLDADARIAKLQELKGAPAPAPVAEAKPAPPPEPPPANPAHRRIYELHDKGLTLPEIEGETGFEKGEIELILGMRKARQ